MSTSTSTPEMAKKPNLHIITEFDSFHEQHSSEDTEDMPGSLYSSMSDFEDTSSDFSSSDDDTHATDGAAKTMNNDLDPEGYIFLIMYATACNEANCKPSALKHNEKAGAYVRSKVSFFDRLHNETDVSMEELWSDWNNWKFE